MLLAIAIILGSGFNLHAKTVKEELDAAKKAKKSVFLVVTATGVPSANSMSIAQQAQKKVKESIVLSMNRDDQSNKELVASFGVGTAPVPLIMVIGMNGIAAGGLTEKDATVEKLVSMVPSKKRVEALAYLNEKKPVFIVVCKKSFKDRQQVTADCRAAVQQLKGNAAVVEVELDDPGEKSLLGQIGADFNAKSTQVIVFNAAGKNTGTYTGSTEAGKLVAAALAVPKSGCCPSGSGKSCGK